MVYQTEKLISEDGDKFSADDKSALQTKVDALKEALKVLRQVLKVLKVQAMTLMLRHKAAVRNILTLTTPR